MKRKNLTNRLFLGCRIVPVSMGRLSIPAEWRGVLDGNRGVCLLPDRGSLILAPTGVVDGELSRLRDMGDAQAIGDLEEKCVRLVADEGFCVAIPRESLDSVGIRGRAALKGEARILRLCPDVSCEGKGEEVWYGNPGT